MSSHAFGSPTWSAEKDFALLMLLAGGNRKAAQQLWLRKGRIRAPPGAGAQQSAPKAAQQVAGLQPKPAPAQAQAVPKPETAAQLARRERSQLQLRQKHLARKMWACVRIASRLLAWRTRSTRRLSERRFHAVLAECRADGPACPCFSSYCTCGDRTAQKPPAPALMAPPPTQQPPLALVAAARTSLDELEMQDNRGSKRDAHARTPPPPPLPPRVRPPPSHGRRLAGPAPCRPHSPPPPQQPPLRSRTPPPPTTPPPSPPPTPPTAPSPEARPRVRLPTPNAARRSAPPPPSPPLATLPQVHASRCLWWAQCPQQQYRPLPHTPHLSCRQPYHPTPKAPPHRAHPTPRRYQICANPTPPPPPPPPLPKSPPSNAQPHRAVPSRRPLHPAPPAPQALL